jgi:hypothetical protein
MLLVKMTTAKHHMIKPGSKDKKVSVLIAGEELTELKRVTWLMSESLVLIRGSRITAASDQSGFTAGILSVY